MNPRAYHLFVFALLLFCPSTHWAQETGGNDQTPKKSSYDPLKISKRLNGQVAAKDLTVVDKPRNRQIPIRIYLPRGDSKNNPLVLFSHGLGGARANNPYLGNHWAERGYVAVFLQHHGSDESVWKNKRAIERIAAMKKAASGENYLLRVQDVSRVLDQLEQWNRSEKHFLANRINMERIGMSGHSFGARTTQAVGGQWTPVIGQKHTDARIKAALAFSPSVPKRGDASRSFGSVSIPWMLMTGTHDESRLTGQDAASRRKVYTALPNSINKYELVLHNAEHSVFSERKLPGDRHGRNPNHHKAILALSTAFWDAHLKDDKPALTWLHGDGAKSVLESKDSWQLQQPTKKKSR